MNLKWSKSHFIWGSATILLGIVLFTVFDLKFLGMGITFSGLMLVFIDMTEIPADEMHLRINEKSGFNAFWAVVGLVGILMYVNHYSPDLLEIRDVIGLVFIVGMITLVVSRFYYIRRGFS